MKSRPILMSAPMVRALLDDRKTQTRRALKRQFLDVLPLTDGSGWIGLVQRGTAEIEPMGEAFRCKFGVPGDLLYVKETWQSEMVPGHERDGPIRYRATQDERCAGHPWKPSIFMPKWASRITLRITDVRCERLQDISEEDAKAEGAAFTCDQCGNDLDDEHGAEVHAACDREYDEGASHRIGYRRLWNSINGKDSWDLNPWTWAVSFEVVK